MMLTYLDNILMMKPPLPWGLHCQKPVNTLTDEVKALLTRGANQNACMQPDPTKHLGNTIPMGGQLQRADGPEPVGSKCCCVIQ